MSQPSREHVTKTLVAVEDVRRQQGLSRHQLADRLGIPFETFRRWFQRTGPRLPSPAHLSQLESYVVRARDEISVWEEVWARIQGWWQTQHRYASSSDLAREIGWDADHLAECLRGEQKPPRLVVERLAENLRIPTPPSKFQEGEAKQRTGRLKALLMLLHEELAWFRDGPEEARRVFRSELDPFDLGYLSSLLAMLSDEDKFKRWLAATTNRFSSFDRRGGRP